MDKPALILSLFNFIILFFILYKSYVLYKIKKHATEIVLSLVDKNISKREKRIIAIKQLMQKINKFDLLFINIDAVEYSIEMAWSCIVKRSL